MNTRYLVAKTKYAIAVRKLNAAIRDGTTDDVASALDARDLAFASLRALVSR